MPSQKFSESLARELRILRATHETTNVHIASLVGLSHSTIAKTMNAAQRIDVDLVVEIIEALGESPQEVIERALKHYGKQK